MKSYEEVLKTVEEFNFQIGHSYRIYYSEGNPNNQILHLRGIVDQDQFIFCFWRKSKRFFSYKIVGAHFLGCLLEGGNLTNSGKSKIKLFEEADDGN